MTARRISLLLLCGVLCPISSPLHAGGQAPGPTMTLDQAYSLLRSHRTDSPGTKPELTLIRRVEAAPGGPQVAQQALQEAQSRHFAAFDDGILVDFLRSGGFIVLESDSKTGSALQLHLVSQDASGASAMQSFNLQASMTKAEALQLLERAGALSDSFFGPPGTMENFVRITSRFGDGRTPSFGGLDGPMCEAPSKSLLELATQPGELSELTSLACAVYLWPLRHSLALPFYAASPAEAVYAAGAELNKLVEGYPPARGNEANYVNGLLDMHSMKTREELAARIQSLRSLAAFLDQHSPLDFDSPTWKANALITQIPLASGSGQDEEGVPGRAFSVLTAPGLLTIWSEPRAGLFVLRVIGETED